MRVTCILEYTGEVDLPTKPQPLSEIYLHHSAGETAGVLMRSWSSFGGSKIVLRIHRTVSLPGVSAQSGIHSGWKKY